MQPKDSKQKKQVDSKKVIKIIAPLAFSMSLFLLVGGFVWPLFILHIPSRYCLEKLQEDNNDWWILILLSDLAVCDLIGRFITLSKKVQKIFSAKVIPYMQVFKTIFQLIFIPMSLPQASIVGGVITYPFICNDVLSLCAVTIHQLIGAIIGPLSWMSFQLLFKDEDEKAKGSLYFNMIVTIG